MSNTQEYVPDEFDLFSQQPLMLCVKGNEVLEYKPLNTVENATSIEFNVLPYQNRYKDANWMFLKLRVQLLKKDGTFYTDSDINQPSLVTNSLHSIFKSAFINLNGNALRSVEQNYGYKEYIEVCVCV